MATPGGAVEAVGAGEELDGSPPVCDVDGTPVGGGAKVVALSVCVVTSLSSLGWWALCCWGEP
ncbi:hypothetical protein [Streptomyces decoyicus]|uniref:hypothetical protein n=1 Tax=Streptomyces decoyicus TaxID=249567 RepID=UPI0012371039|nr:hypothetical protein [Streptomyces decoyicus]QZY14532.1 hypothetical protein K7C20_04100 [Streptomyces decoyicus]